MDLNQLDLALIAKTHGLTDETVAQLIERLNNKDTVPYLAHLCPELPGRLNEFNIAAIQKTWLEHKSLCEKQRKVTQAAKENNKLTAELEHDIKTATSKSELNDILEWCRHKSSVTDENCHALATRLWEQTTIDQPLEAIIGEQLKDNDSSLEKALDQLRRILIENLSLDHKSKKALRDFFNNTGKYKVRPTAKCKEQKNQYKDLADAEYPVSQIPMHNYFLIQRGQKYRFLDTEILVDDDQALKILGDLHLKTDNPALRFQLEAVISEAYHTNIKKSLSTEIKQLMRENMQELAMQNFCSNLHNQMLTPEFGQKPIIVLIFENATTAHLFAFDQQLQQTQTIKIDWNARDQAITTFIEALTSAAPKAVIIGKNGQTPADVSELKKAAMSQETKPVFLYRKCKDFEDENNTPEQRQKEAHHLAFMLQNPALAIASSDLLQIQVGPFQTDVDQNQLAHRLHLVVQNSLARAGLAINHANATALSHLPGLNETWAQALIAARDKLGTFKTRTEIRQSTDISDDLFEQFIGFVIIPDSASASNHFVLHPKHDALLEKITNNKQVTANDLIKGIHAGKIKADDCSKDLDETEKQTLSLLIKNITGGLDARLSFRVPETLNKVFTIQDCQENQIVSGIITSILNYGVLVDIGIDHDVLLHKSSLPKVMQSKFARMLKIGQVITAKIITNTKDSRLQLAWQESQRPQNKPKARNIKQGVGKNKPHRKSDQGKPKKKRSFGTLGDQFAQIFDQK